MAERRTRRRPSPLAKCVCCALPRQARAPPVDACARIAGLWPGAPALARCLARRHPGHTDARSARAGDPALARESQRG